MNFLTRILCGGVCGAVWSVLGTEAVEWFGLAGPSAPITALVILLITVTGYSLYRRWGFKTTVSLGAATALSFVVGFILYFAWSATTSFPDTASLLPPR